LERRPQQRHSTDYKEIAMTAAEKNIPTKQDLKTLLEQNIIKVDFLKLNGDRRTMTCTLREDLKPAATRSDTVSQRAVRETAESVICVWDVNAQGWRSFRYDRIINVDSVISNVDDETGDTDDTEHTP